VAALTPLVPPAGRALHNAGTELEAEAGLWRTRREGNRTLVAAALDASIAPELQSLLAKLYGPPARICDTLASIPGVQRAVIFGSWAARWLGTPGPAPHDIDLLMVGGRSRRGLDRSRRPDPRAGHEGQPDDPHPRRVG
jgi:hypothetical protein